MKTLRPTVDIHVFDQEILKIYIKIAHKENQKINCLEHFQLYLTQDHYHSLSFFMSPADMYPVYNGWYIGPASIVQMAE